MNCDLALDTIVNSIEKGVLVGGAVGLVLAHRDQTGFGLEFYSTMV